MSTEPAPGPASQELAKTFDPAAIEARWYAPLGRPPGCSAPSGRTPRPSPSSTRRPTSPAACTSATRSTTRCRTWSSATSGCAGKDALWVVGTDHAGIATQMVVERQMQERQDKRTNYTREEFVGKVWEWKEESGGTITRQLRRLGCSMDWSREQFTMDPHFTAAVTKVFVDMYNDGLIYRAKRLVNWDPALKTAISDLEVESREVQGHMWHFKYPLAGGETYTYVERDADGNGDAGRDARLHRDRHHPARNDAGRRRGGGAPVRRALCLDRRQAVRDPGGPEGASPPDPDHHRRISRSRVRVGRGQDHRRARRERLRRRQPQRHPDVPADGRGRRAAQRRRALRRGFRQGARNRRGGSVRCGRDRRAQPRARRISRARPLRGARSAWSPTSTPKG